jgi:hypothetical protein
MARNYRKLVSVKTNIVRESVGEIDTKVMVMKQLGLPIRRTMR